MMDRLLIITASPIDRPRLRVDIEVRAIRNSLRAGNPAQGFEIDYLGAAQYEDIQRCLRSFRPHFVHFAGTHNEDPPGLILEDSGRHSRIASVEWFVSLFKNFGNEVKCLTLSSCFLGRSVEQFGQYVQNVIAMRKRFQDDACNIFMSEFYGSLAAGNSVKNAFESAKDMLSIKKAQESPDPVLYVNPQLEGRTQAYKHFNEESISGQKRILLLSAQPSDTQSLNLDQEARYIRFGLYDSGYWKNFSLRYCPAVQSSDIFREVYTFRPHFIHFMGHGTHQGDIVVEGKEDKHETIDAQGLISILKPLTNQIECIILNSYKSSILAAQIMKITQFAIGIENPLPDHEAVVFSDCFYSALGSGATAEEAFEFAQARVKKISGNGFRLYKRIETMSEQPEEEQRATNTSVIKKVNSESLKTDKAATANKSTEGPEKVILAWMHLSDIHVGHGDATHGWDQQLVLNALAADISVAMRMASLSEVNAILVTGDIAFSGATRSTSEYSDATTFLRSVASSVGLGPDAVYLVPGNHDVQRSADVNRNIRRLLRDLREGDESLDEALGNPDDRALLAQRQERYWKFAHQFAPACHSQNLVQTSQLSWACPLIIQGFQIRLIGLNTALLAADDQDRGRLRLGLSTLGESFLKPSTEPNELVIVLSHHPLRGGWLADEKNIDAWIRSRAHIHLSGHIHEADSEGVLSGGGSGFVRVSAGAAHAESSVSGDSSGHSYNLAAVVQKPDGALTLRVWPRRWSDKNKYFRLDTDNIPAGQTYAEHLLRLCIPVREK